MIRMMMCQLLAAAQDVPTEEWRYAWQEVQVDPATNEVTPVEGGRSGSTEENYAVIPGNFHLPIDPLDPPLTPYQIQQRGYVANVMTWWAFTAMNGFGRENYVAFFTAAQTEVQSLDVELRTFTLINSFQVRGPGTSVDPEPRFTGTAILDAQAQPGAGSTDDHAAQLQLLCPAMPPVTFNTGYTVTVYAGSDAACNSVVQLFRFLDTPTNLAQGTLSVQYDSTGNRVTFGFGASGTPTGIPGLKAKLLINGSEPATYGSTNVWTDQNTFLALVPTATPVKVQGAAGQTENIVEFTSNGNTSGVDENGHFFGSGAGLTNLNASQLTSGTIPPARFGTIDGGTW